MFDFVKILVEEPAKLRKFVFFVLKFILSVIVTSKFYSWIYGKYILVDFTFPEFWNELYDFILSGNILLVFFLYLVSHSLLFDVFASIASLILNSISKNLFSNKKDLNDNDLIRVILKSLEVITFDKQTKKAGIGENFDGFYLVLNSYQNNQTKEEVHSFKNSFMNETLHVYFVFVLIYFCFLEVEKANIFTTVLLIGLVINVFLYLILYFSIQFFNSNGKNILFGLNILNIEKVIVEFLNDNRVPFSENDKNLNNILSKFIIFKDKECVIDIYTGKTPITKLSMDRYLQQALKSNKKKLILVSEKRLTTKAKKCLKNNQVDIDFIYYKSTVNLNKKFEKLFYD